MASKEDPNFLKVVGKAFHVLEATAEAKDGERISDLAQAPPAEGYDISHLLHFPKAGIREEGCGYRRLPSNRPDTRTHPRHWARGIVPGGAAAYGTAAGAVRADGKSRDPARNRVLYLDILEGLRSIRMAATTQRMPLSMQQRSAKRYWHFSRLRKLSCC